MSTVLAGTWKASPRAGKVCTYSSDRGAIFAIQVRGLWIFVIIPTGGGSHDGELGAMTALLRVAR